MNENTVERALVENSDAAIYVMEHVTSSTGALSGAKKHFADEYDYEFSAVDGTLFTKGYGRAEKVAAVKVNDD